MMDAAGDGNNEHGDKGEKRGRSRIFIVLVRSPAHVAQWGERWNLKPTSIWQPGSSRSGARYLLLNGMVCGRWQRQRSRSDDVS